MANVAVDLTSEVGPKKNLAKIRAIRAICCALGGGELSEGPHECGSYTHVPPPPPAAAPALGLLFAPCRLSRRPSLLLPPPPPPVALFLLLLAVCCY